MILSQAFFEAHTFQVALVLYLPEQIQINWNEEYLCAICVVEVEIDRTFGPRRPSSAVVIAVGIWWTLFLPVPSSGDCGSHTTEECGINPLHSSQILFGVLYCSCVLVFVIVWHPWVCHTTGACLRPVECFQFAKFVYSSRNYSPSQVEWVGKMLFAILLLTMFTNPETVQTSESP